MLSPGPEQRPATAVCPGGLPGPQFASPGPGGRELLRSGAKPAPAIASAGGVGYGLFSSGNAGSPCASVWLHGERHVVPGPVLRIGVAGTTHRGRGQSRCAVTAGSKIPSACGCRGAAGNRKSRDPGALQPCPPTDPPTLGSQGYCNGPRGTGMSPGCHRGWSAPSQPGASPVAHVGVRVFHLLPPHLTQLAD